jgi:hypothetical protein
MLLVFDCCVHRPVQSFKLGEAHNDSGFCLARQNVLLRHTEDCVQNVNLNLWP